MSVRTPRAGSWRASWIGSSAIERERLLELPEHSWPEHTAGKIWVDVDEFATAWLIALLLHGYKAKRKDLLDAFGRLPPRRPPKNWPRR